MRIALKPLADQAIVITGASSGIGLVTARRAAAAGAGVMLVARNGEALAEAVAGIERDGGSATYAIADVADPAALRRAADAAVARFGRIDSWVSNAGVAIYATLPIPPSTSTSGCSAPTISARSTARRSRSTCSAMAARSSPSARSPRNCPHRSSAPMRRRSMR